jgi:hypothetical protein
MTPDSPLHRALTAWRVAERRLSMVDTDDPARAGLLAEVERRRLAYQAQFGAVEDVAGHGAPYVDEPDDEVRAKGEGDAPPTSPAPPAVGTGSR